MPSRQRFVKPDTVFDSTVARLRPHTRLLYFLLPMLADRAGRLVENHVEIRAVLLPLDHDLDVPAMLHELETPGAGLAPLITRYTARVKGRPEPLLQLRRFDLEQTPHRKERASILPSPSAGSQLKLLG